MKKFGLFCVALGLAVLPSAAFAIDITAAGPSATWTFDTAPAAADFASGGVAGAGATANDEAGLDAAIIPTDASLYGSPVGSSATNPPTSTNALFRHNTSGLWLQSAATGNTATVLKATLNNETPNYVTDLAVSFDLGVTTPEAGTVTGIPGYRVYWSATGAANSWTPAGTFATAGPISFNISGLGTTFGDNPLYILWADDNADGGTEGQYNIDNVVFNATLGGPKAPPVPEFGTQLPPAGNTVGAGDLDLATQAGGVVLDEAGNNVLHLNNGSLSLLTEQVDLRGVDTNADQVRVSVDLRTLDSSDGSDFETSDSLAVVAEWSADGLTFQSIDLYNQNGGNPGDPAVWPAADDELKLLDTGAGGAFTNFSAILPANAETVRVRVTAVNNSATENFYLDNLNVSLVPVPEPATIAMFGLGMIGLVGYRRRRSA